ncbi:MAG: hypothetical protein NTX51_07385 [Verrucomicrobia bacterium]|nr:hypothetical protein [Verrucomicrobiota bacterium]
MKTEQKSFGEKTAQGLDTVTRYNVAVRNAPGQFAMLHKSELAVDPAYQRNNINQRRVDAITRTWDWVACGCLVVALRDDDKWFVVDGQHRKLAADQRADIQELPCLVFETTSRRQEAVSFLAINQGRVGVGSLDRYRAQLLSGDKTAFAVESLLKSTGHRAGDTPSARTVSCVACLYNLASEDCARFQRLWPLLAELHPDGPMTDAVIRGLWTVDKWLGERSVTEPPYREKLLVIGGKGLNHEIRREMAVIGQGGSRVCACAIAKYLNKQRMPAHLKIQLS